MGKNDTFHIYVKSEPGYSPKYPEHVFSVIGLSLDTTAQIDFIVTEGILLSAEIMFASKSDPFKKVF